MEMDASERHKTDWRGLGIVITSVHPYIIQKLGIESGDSPVQPGDHIVSVKDVPVRMLDLKELSSRVLNSHLLNSRSSVPLQMALGSRLRQAC
mmetsp:Transcript_19882/g.66191  ORF Transcript_19882/g.66191 Transcript_19882/m.66191 type:complete len:93 (+) Transcript_19882:1069-1347(+)